MKKILLIIFLLPLLSNAQGLGKVFKFATFYAAVNGGTSLSDNDTYKITSGQLEQSIIETPYDYSISLGEQGRKAVNLLFKKSGHSFENIFFPKFAK